MKTLLTTFSLLALSLVANATKYVYAKVVLADGTARVGLVENSLDNDYVRFKSADGAEPEKIASDGIRTVAYLKEDMQTPVAEYDRIKVYLGWGQRRISNYAWFEVVERGIATLYVRRGEMRGSIYGTGTAGFLDYFVMRDGEPAAKMIANVSSFNNNQTFRAKAPLYFADDAELAEKIKSKEYTWKDLVPVVKQYNTWAAANKK